MVAGGQESLAQSPGKSSVGKAILIGCGLLMLVGCATLVLLVGSLFFLRTSVRQNAMAEETWLEAKNSLESIEFNGKNAPASQGEKAAVAAAETWLALVDKGDSEQTWKDASPFFRASVTEEIWKSAMERFRKPLGKLNSRKLKFAQSVKSLPGAPDGEYVVMQFDTSLASKNSAVETVTFTHESDGQWWALGYFIK